MLKSKRKMFFSKRNKILAVLIVFFLFAAQSGLSHNFRANATEAPMANSDPSAADNPGDSDSYADSDENGGEIYYNAEDGETYYRTDGAGADDAVADGAEAGNAGANGAGTDDAEPDDSAFGGNAGSPADTSDGGQIGGKSSNSGVPGQISNSPSFHQPAPIGPLENDVSVYRNYGPYSAFDPPDFDEMDADSYILIERRTGQTICAKNPEDRLFPASTSKIMTAILAIEMGDMGAVYTASPRAVRDIGPDGSNIGIIAGEKMRLDNLLDALLVKSANETANIIAEGVCDTRDEFISLMNKKARDLGAYNTNFSNTSGIHEPTHYTTAYDLALIANYAMNNPEFRAIVRQRSIILNPTNKHDSWEKMNTTNNLLYDDNIKGYKVTGVKTGFHSEAGYCVVASGIDENNMELLCVVLGVHGTVAGTSAKRFKIASDLLSYGFANFKMSTFIHDNEKVGSASVLGGDNLDSVDALSDGTIKLFLPVDKTKWNVSRIEYIKSETVAPVLSGDTIGYVEFRNSGDFAGRVNLVASTDIPALKGGVRDFPKRVDTGSARSELSLSADTPPTVGAARGLKGESAGQGNAADVSENDDGLSAYTWARDTSGSKTFSALVGSIDFFGIFKGILLTILILATLISIIRIYNILRKRRLREKRLQYHGRLNYPPVRGLFRKGPQDRRREKIKYDMPGTRQIYGDNEAPRGYGDGYASGAYDTGNAPRLSGRDYVMGAYDAGNASRLSGRDYVMGAYDRDYPANAYGRDYTSGAYGREYPSGRNESSGIRNRRGRDYQNNDYDYDENTRNDGVL